MTQGRIASIAARRMTGLAAGPAQACTLALKLPAMSRTRS